MVYRVATALGEWASQNKINGLSEWTAHDFAVDAEKFVFTLEQSVAWHSDPEIKREHTEGSYRRDLVEYLQWGINEKHRLSAINACLFEVGPDYTGLDFDNNE